MNKHIDVVESSHRTDIDGGFDGDGQQEQGPVGVQRAFLAQRQKAEFSLMVNKEAGLKATAEITKGGLLSIAALASSILLATTVLVHRAVRENKRRRWP